MLYRLSILLFLLSISRVYGQSPKATADKYLEFLNEYQSDSLRNLLTDDFLIKRTFANYTNDKSSFLNSYITYSKNFNGKYRVLEVVADEETVHYLVEDQSDYLKYLRIEYPTWKIAVTTKENKVQTVVIDTTETTSKYLADVKKKDIGFKDWMKNRHPEENQASLYNVEGLLIKRLKEYDAEIIDVEMEKWLSENQVPTLGIGIIEDGKLQRASVFGELRKGVSAPVNTIFNVASLTKPITAIVTLKLISAGKWNLDEPLYKYWVDPDVAKDHNRKILTTRHILSHQSGFSNWRGNNKDGKLHFEFKPGTQYQYSGEGFEYLRNALEKNFKKSLAQLADELIFNPLDMKDTQFFWNGKTDSARVALGYNKEGVPYKTVKNKTANAADDLLTTVEDYGKFLISVMNGDALKPSVFNEMITAQVKTKNEKYFGLGFEIYDLGNGEYALSHGGSDIGCHTIVFMLPKTKQGLIIFTNVDEGYLVYEKIIKHYLGANGSKIFDIEMRKE